MTHPRFSAVGSIFVLEALRITDILLSKQNQTTNASCPLSSAYDN